MNKGSFYKMMLVQIGIFLGYNLLSFYLHSAFFLLIAIAIHATGLIAFAIVHFRKKETQKAFGFLMPLLVVLLIGLGSCAGMFSMMGASAFENMKAKYDSTHKANHDKKPDADQSNKHKASDKKKPNPQRGIPKGRYKWVKRGRK